MLVSSSAISNGNGTIENPMKSLYYALVNGYDDYSKVYLIDEEIDIFIDESSSVFMSDITYPLNSNTLYIT